MFTVALIAFREFLEAFLIVGVFLGISKRLGLKKELEIGLAAGIGILVSLLLSTLTYIFAGYAGTVLTEKSADLLESYLMIFSGIFIAYVIFSLHEMMNRGRGQKILKAHKQLSKNAFNISLFLTIIFLVSREGFETALFTASTSLFSAFMQNILGLLIGFGAATVIGLLSFLAYIKLPIGRVFKVTEYMIILLGAALLQGGITTLLETHFNISISQMIPFDLHFIPDEDSFIGHALKGLFGLDRDFSLMRLGIMVLYIGVIYFIFLRLRKNSSPSEH